MSLAEQYQFTVVAVPVLVAVMVVLGLTQIAKKFIYLPKISPMDMVTKNKTINEKLEALIVESGYGNVLDVVKLYQIIVTLLIIVAASLFLRGLIIPGLVMGPLVGVSAPLAFLYYSQTKRQDRIELQLVDFLNEMQTRMQVSNSTFTAFVNSISNAQYPLRPILEKIAKNAQQLKSFEVALESSRNLINSVYYQDFVDAVQINSEAGGDVRALIKMVVEQINNKMITLKKFKAAMAAINIQLIIIFAAPPGAAWLVIFQSPESGRILFNTFFGMVILFIALACYAGGVGFSVWLKNRVKKQIG
jgi:Flp pilus assembly protein TadB